MMRKLGQHFLINKDKIKKIVGALKLEDGDIVIEIGPGHGELTEVLGFRLKVLGENWNLIAIEKDKNLFHLLENKFKHKKNIKVIEGDILKLLKSKTQNLTPKTYKIVGNIPYYLTGYLLRILGELKKKPRLTVLTIQKEVAQRIVAKPPKMNLLAASVQFWAKPEIIDYISRKDFWPAPKVDSAIIKLTPKTQKLKPKTYYRFIKIFFKQPRKTAMNNLRPTTNNLPLLRKKIQSIGVNPDDRPQSLSLEQIIKLSQILQDEKLITY